MIEKNLSSLDLAAKKSLIDVDHAHLRIKHQCELVELNRASYYAKSTGLKDYDYKVLNKMDEIFTQHPYYGTRRIMHALS